MGEPCVDSDITPTEKYQKAIFLHVIGVTGLKLYNSIVFTALEDEDDVNLIIDKLESIIIGQVNVILLPIVEQVALVNDVDLPYDDTFQFVNYQVYVVLVFQSSKDNAIVQL